MNKRDELKKKKQELKERSRQIKGEFKNYENDAAIEDVKALSSKNTPKWWEHIFVFGTLFYFLRILFEIFKFKGHILRRKVFFEFLLWSLFLMWSLTLVITLFLSPLFLYLVTESAISKVKGKLSN